VKHFKSAVERAKERRELGELAEDCVVRYLRQRATQIVATNLRIGSLELDIVAREGPVIIVIEVRTRSSSALSSGFGSIDRAKQLRIRRAGERLWQRRYKHDPSAERMRFDAASVRFERGEPKVEYVRAAF
jgi:putative endonuclease